MLQDKGHTTFRLAEVLGSGFKGLLDSDQSDFDRLGMQLNPIP